MKTIKGSRLDIFVVAQPVAQFNNLEFKIYRRYTKDWSWDIVDEFLKRTLSTIKILKVIVLN